LPVPRTDARPGDRCRPPYPQSFRVATALRHAARETFEHRASPTTRTICASAACIAPWGRSVPESPLPAAPAL